MARSYAELSALVSQQLQDTGITTFVAAEINYQIAESLKEISSISPHLVDVMFKIESRYGIDVTGTAGSLTDLVKLQFLAADATNEKVVHNITDNTWAVILVNSSISVNTLSADIMDANEQYEIYNKRCKNKRQVYIGDMLPTITEIDSVEYPLGTKRNFKVYDKVIEIDKATVPDSNLNVTQLPDLDVLVRFAKPHQLCQLTTLAGTLSAEAVAAATSIAVTGLAPVTTGVVNIGDEFYLENHRSLYTAVAATTLNGSGAGTLTIYPGLEAVATSASAITFSKSTLTPQEEEALTNLIVGNLMINKAPLFANAISLGGGSVWENYLTMGQGKVNKALVALGRTTPPKTSRTYSPF